MAVQQSALRAARPFDLAGRVEGRRLWTISGIVTIIGALVVAGISFAILLGLTPVAPDVRATQVIIGVNLVFVLLLVGLIGRETFRIIMARRRRKAASRLHVRIVTMFALVAAIPAVMAYNYFLRRIRVLESELETFSKDYLNIVRRHFLRG